MVRPLVGSGAFAASVVAHALLLGSGALLLSHSLRDRGRARVPVSSAAARVIEVELPAFDPSASDQERESAVPAAELLSPPPGGGPLERHPDTEHAGRGGSRTAPDPATNLDSHVDPISLETDALTHLDRSQVQRLRTAPLRRSLDDHRATPSPMELTFLATGKGAIRERREVARSAPGSVAATVAAALGGVPGASDPESDSNLELSLGAAQPGRRAAEPQPGAPGAAPAPLSRGAQVLLARPWVQRARPALPTEVRARPSDVDDSAQAVAARVAALIHASTVGAPRGPGVGGEPTGGPPGRSGSEGEGSHAAPSGFGPGPDALNDPGIQGFVANLKQRVDEQLGRAFPDWAIEAGRSGHVIIELSVLSDGRLERVRLVRPSGIDEYDGNVLTGVRRIPGFGPLPRALGRRALITMSYDSLNHVVGRQGPGPGGYGALRQTSR